MAAVDFEDGAVEEDIQVEVEGLAMTAEEEAEAAALVEAELAALEEDDDGMAVEDTTGVEATEVLCPESEGPEAAVYPNLNAPWRNALAPAAPASNASSKGKGKDFGGARSMPYTPGKGKVNGFGGKGKVDGSAFNGKGGGGAPQAEQFFGLIHQVGEKTGNMLVKSWKVTERYGQEVMIPKMSNPAGAKLGDKVAFEVLERPDGARPLAINVQIRGHIDLSNQEVGPPNELRRQVLYYMSDDNLRFDKFFQEKIKENEDGWLSMAVILGCPRMKQMNATLEAVYAACQDAEEIEFKLEPAGEEAVRRAGGAPPPPLEEKGKGDKGKGKGKPPGPGDWPCPSCGANNFAFRDTCFRCNTPKPATLGKGTAGLAPGGKAAGKQPSPPVTAPAALRPQAASFAPAALPSRPAQPATASSAPSRSDLFYAGVVGSQGSTAPFKYFLTCDAVTNTFGQDAYFLSNQKPDNVEVGDLVIFTVPPNSQVGQSPHANFVAQLAPLGSLVLGSHNGTRAEPEPALGVEAAPQRPVAVAKPAIAKKPSIAKTPGAKAPVAKGPPSVQKTIVKTKSPASVSLVD